MKNLTGNEIREQFLQYFEKQNHARVDSSSLVPHDDPTLLFANAGMNQFKDIFLGNETRDYKRATTSQKCVRAGGKHNDLENVGRTARHHTFFEMLGNFSFGDYFKSDAIRFGWDFLINVLGLPKDKMWITIFDDDDEAFEIWHNQEGVPKDRIVRMGEKDNFWAMGDTGPCGPCSEIHIDQGEHMACGPECSIDGCDCDRYLELWNLVFMQFNRSEDGTMTPLPKPSIDTGMGLERIACIVQGKNSNYDTDLLRAIITTVEKASGKAYGDNEDNDVSMRVIADHSRATAFLIGDGVLPSNEGRGYVLRRIMRRAARHAKLLGFDEPMLYKACHTVIEMMGAAYPDIKDKAGYIEKVVKNEEERFIQTLDKGLKILEEIVATQKESNSTIIPGKEVFKLYDTFGFPTDLTADIVEKDGYSLDMDGFDEAMTAQQEQGRENWKGAGGEGTSAVYKKMVDGGTTSEFCGYNDLVAEAPVKALLVDGQQVQQAGEGSTVEVVTSVTPFYGESGGQVGDRGSIETDNGKLTVLDCKKPVEGLTVAVAEVNSGEISVGDIASMAVDTDARQATVLNHSATHILQAVLRNVLGDHIKQAGSLVAPDRLRFDFTHFSAVTRDELNRIETEVNQWVRANTPVAVAEMGQQEAIDAGATALFGEKYGDTVRVVRMGDFSMELCGGTHAESTGDIGLFKILHEQGIAAGVRRLEAVTGADALALTQQTEERLHSAADLVKAAPQNLEEKIQKLLEHQKALEKEIQQIKAQASAGIGDQLLAEAQDVNGIKLVAAKVDGLDGKALRELSDTLRDKIGSGIVVLGAPQGEKASLLVAVTKDLTGQVKAGELIKPLAAKVGGKGGGRPDMAQAGGSQPENLNQAMDAAPALLQELLG